MTRKKRRLVTIGLAMATFGTAVGLTLYALRDSIVFFYGPSEYAAKAPKPGTRLRIGGLVETGSFSRDPDRTVHFAVTDTKADVHVVYAGLLPDLFREGQGAVVEGTVEPGGLFRADSVLAKHDERYMPREVADALKRQGVWNEGAAPPPAVTPSVAYVPSRTVSGTNRRASAEP